jgi:hypothetical protein
MGNNRQSEAKVLKTGSNLFLQLSGWTCSLRGWGVSLSWEEMIADRLLCRQPSQQNRCPAQLPVAANHLLFI